MNKSTFTPEYEAFRRWLVRHRETAGLSQRGLGKRLGRVRSFVSRIEQKERRLDVVEFYWFCRDLGLNVEKAAVEIMREIKAADPSSAKAGPKRHRK